MNPSTCCPQPCHDSLNLLPTLLCLHISPCTGRIWLDNLSCSGNEQSVAECTSRGWGNSDCTHDEDAGVICKDQRLPGFSDSNVIEARAGWPERAVGRGAH